MNVVGLIVFIFRILIFVVFVGQHRCKVAMVPVHLCAVGPESHSLSDFGNKTISSYG